MAKLSSPIGLLGVYLPENVSEDTLVDRVNHYCKVVYAEFFEDDSGNLYVEFLNDGARVEIDLKEFAVLP